MTRTAYSTTPRRPGLLSRLRARNTPGTTRTTRSSRRGLGGTTTTTTTTKTTKTTHNPVGATGTTGVTHHHRRHATLGDKISGAFLRLRGSLSRRPGKKAAGTRRMHGTDGRVARRHNRRTCRSSHTVPDPPAPDLPRKPSAVVADEALNTAVHLVTRIQTLQAHTEVVEAALEAKETELEKAIDDRDKWKERAESIISLGAQTLHEQSTEVEGLKRRVTDLEMQRDELAVTSQQAEEQVQALKEDLAATVAEGEAKESSPSPEEEKSDSEPGERKDPDDEPQPITASSAEKEKDPEDDDTIQENPPPREGEEPSSPKDHPDPIPDEEEEEQEESLSTVQLGS